MILSFTRHPASTLHSSIVILHGLFGQARNWQTPGRSLARITQMPVYAVNLRNHGTGQARQPSMSLEEMTQDVVETCLQCIPGNVHLVGHSLGGKIAMQGVLSVGNAAFRRTVRSLTVVDMAPKPYAVDRMLGYMRVMVDINSRDYTDRRLVAEHFKRHEPSDSIAGFLMTNLARRADGAWQFDLPLATLLSALGRESTRPFPVGVFAKCMDTPALFVRGARSDYVTAGDEARIGELFAHYRVVSVADAGHWVHSQQPEHFASIVGQFILENSK